MNPLWNPAAKSASLRKWADHLHKEAKVGLGEHRTISDEELQWFAGPRKA
jgi:hypothetical protein